ncbi:MAG: hypothetical protein AAB600_03765 [Patescibacteria group bacterium]
MIIKSILKDKFYFLLAFLITLLIGIQLSKAPSSIADNLTLYVYSFVIIVLLIYTGYQSLGSERENKVLSLTMTATSTIVSFFIWWGTQLIGLVACINAGQECLNQIQNALSPIKYFYLGLPLLILLRPKNKVHFLLIVAAYLLLLIVLV